MQRGKKVVVYIVIICLVVTGILYIMQEKFIFLPTKLPQDFSYEFSHPFEEIFLTTKDGAKLNALHFKAKNPKGVILYFHGNAGDLSRWGNIAAFFVPLEYDVLVMDYRTYGKSTGKLSEAALLKDAQLFYEYANNQYSEENMIVYGRSIGTSMATYVASINSPEKLILETPFYSLEDLVEKRFPIIPLKKLLKYKLRTNEYIKDVKSPILIIHGTDDSIVPYDSGKKLFEIISNNNGQFVTIPGGNHNDLIEFKEYTEAIQEVLK